MYKNDLAAIQAKIGYDPILFNYIQKKIPSYYEPFHLVTIKNGKKKTRHIDSPGKNSALSVLQKAINKSLLVTEVSLLPPAMIGSIKGRSLIKHIEPHVDQPTVVCMDLQHCFPNINQQRVYKTWNEILGYSPELAKILTQITTIRGYLPQGPPTSPLLCNFALSRMANEIQLLCQANGLTYTQYVDDICISGDDVVARAVIKEVHKIVKSFGQNIKDVKTEIMDQKHQQRSMGVVLNKNPKLIKDYALGINTELDIIIEKGVISTGEKLRLVGKIIYLNKFNKKESLTLRKKLNQQLMLLAQIDKKLPKRGNVKRCFHNQKNRYNNSRCQYL